MTSLSTSVARVVAAHARLDGVISALTDEQARGPSALPGWTRGHVLTHVADLARALTRQVHHGTRFEMYDGGRPGRAAAIEAGAGRSAAELREDVRRSSADLEKAWAELRDWDRAISYRDATVAITVPTRWREVEIHTADLDLGYRPADWALEFCEHVIEYLGRRVPAGVRLTLDSPHGTWTIGEGTDVRVSGDVADIAAWLAGRAHGDLAARPSLPDLGPWP